VKCDFRFGLHRPVDAKLSVAGIDALQADACLISISGSDGCPDQDRSRSIVWLRKIACLPCPARCDIAAVILWSVSLPCPAQCLFWRAQPYAAKAFSGRDHVLNDRDFQQGRYGFLGVTGARSDVLARTTGFGART